MALFIPLFITNRSLVMDHASLINYIVQNHLNAYYMLFKREPSGTSD